MKYALVTGSAGLIGSEAVAFLVGKAYRVVGIDNDMRAHFFGEEASTRRNNERLKAELGEGYIHVSADIRDNEAMDALFQEYPFELIIHAAAQPSHDWATRDPHTDFSINATGTLVILEHFRRYCPKATFIFTSTNKVYGDRPNLLPLVELETRFEIAPDHEYANGVSETMSVDNTLHSVFGVSKVAADIMVQEYGKYFKLNTGVFRGGCLTGPHHNGAELHGFLAYLVKCIAQGRKYTIFGYKGKQVRDNIHSADLVNMFWQYHQSPKQGEVYNAGGGRFANISILEAISKIEKILNKKAVYEYSPENRVGDHIWYVSDMSKFMSQYPEWKPEYTIDRTLEEMCREITRHGVGVS